MEEEKKNQENEIVQMNEEMTKVNPVDAVNEEKVSINEIKPPKNNNGLVSILVFIILLLAGGLVYVLFFMKGDEKDKRGENVEPTPSVTPSPIPTKEAENTDDNDETYELKGSDYYDGENWVIKTKTKDAKVITRSLNTGKNILYIDNGMKIYNVDTNKSQNINLEDKYKDYGILETYDGDVKAISYINNNKYGYYNVSAGKKMYEDKYKYSNDSYGFSIIDDDYMYLLSDGNTYLLKIKEEKEILSVKNDDKLYYSYSFSVFGKDKPVFVQELCTEDECSIKKLYDSNANVFYNGSVLDDFMSYINNYIYILNDKKIEKYDLNGKLISTSKEYNNVLQIIRNYVVYYNNNDLILENIDDNSESQIISNNFQSDSYDSFTSGYYTREDLDRLDEKNKNEGLYLVIYYGYDGGGAIKNNNGNYGIEYCYTPDKQIVEYPIKEEMGGRAKPVLYLYPEEETNVKVEFAHPEYLTTTYPKYNGSWNVTVKPNGDMKDENGKYYYALYWDEKRYNEVDFHEGFYVESKDAINFLEEKLSIIGLNDKERNEFIMYWLPIMENNKKNLVYFELTEEREIGNKLIITPTPNSLLRVSIHIKKVNEKVSIKEQKLSTFTRVGFTAVEWGGMTY